MTIRNDVSVDWGSSPRIITVAAPSTEITIQDLHDTLRDLEDRADDLTYDELVDSAGKESLGGGVYVGITMTLNNAQLAFEARGGPAFVQCNVSGGNLVAVDDVGANLDPIYTTAYTQVIRTSSSSATLQELSSIQFSSFNGGITVDITSPYSGTDFPIGTPQQPVNNLSDALTIANSRGFTALYIIGDLTLDSGLDFSGLSIIGESVSKSIIDVDSDANVYRTEFYEATITGVLDGESILRNCRIRDLDYISGFVEQCILDTGTITLAGTHASFLDCWCVVDDQTLVPVIDMGGSGTALSIRNYNGCIQMSNKTGTENVTILLNAGGVTLNSSVTNGNITITGVGQLIDNSNGAIIDSSGLVSPGSVAEAVDTLIGPTLDRALGLSQENYYLDNCAYTEYQGQSYMTSGRLRIYSDAGSVGTDSNVVATYQIIATWSLGQMQTYKVIKV